jgi:predicted RNA binding protein YcfA (HicA-like mRNA interferase family)
MKWNELRRIAEKMGWQLYRNGADHDVYRHPDKPKDEVIYIGRHGKQEVAKGTYNKLKKQIGF